MQPYQARLLALSCLVVPLYLVACLKGDNTTKLAAATACACWLVVVAAEMLAGSSFQIAFVGDAVYATTWSAIAWRQRVSWPVLVVAGQASALLVLFLLLDLTNSNPYLAIVGYNVLAISGPLGLAGLVGRQQLDKIAHSGRTHLPKTFGRAALSRVRSGPV